MPTLDQLVIDINVNTEELDSTERKFAKLESSLEKLAKATESIFSSLNTAVEKLSTSVQQIADNVGISDLDSIVTKNDSFIRDIPLKDLVADLVGAVVGIVASLVVGPVAGAMIGIITSHLISAIDFDYLSSVVSSKMSEFTQETGETMAGVVTGIEEFVGTTVENIGSFFSGFGTEIGTTLDRLVKGTESGSTTTVSFESQMLGSKKGTDEAAASIQKAAKEVEAFNANLREVEKNTMPAVEEGVSSGFDKIGESTDDLSKKIDDTVETGFVATMKRAFSDIAGDWVKLLGEMDNGFGAFIRSLGSSAGGLDITSILVPGTGSGSGSFDLTSIFEIFKGGNFSDIPWEAMAADAASVALAAIPGVGPALSAGMSVFGEDLISSFVSGIGSLFGFGGKKTYGLYLGGAVSDILSDIEGSFSIDSSRAGEAEGPFVELLQTVLGSVESVLEGLSPDAVAEFLATNLDLDGGGRYKSGSKARSSITAFVTGGFVDPLFEQLEGSFITALTDVGATTEIASGFTSTLGEQLDQILADTTDWSRREERGKLMGQALEGFLEQLSILDSALDNIPEQFQHIAEGILNSGASLEEVVSEISTLEKATSLLNPASFDSVSMTISQVERLAETLGFEGIPTMDEFQASLQHLINTAQLDPNTVDAYEQLGEAIDALNLDVTNSIVSLSGLVSGLESDLGVSAFASRGALEETINSIMTTLMAGDISASERERLIFELSTLADMMNAIDTREAEEFFEAEQELLDDKIALLEDERSLIEENYDLRIEGLERELELAEKLRDLSERIQDDIDAIVFGSGSPLTEVEQFNRLRTEISQAQTALDAATTTDAQITAIDRLRDLQNELYNLGTTAFGQDSAELSGLFTEVTSALTELGAITDTGSRTIEQIEAEIAHINELQLNELSYIDDQIARLRDETDELGTAQLRALSRMGSEAAQYYSFIYTQATDLLDDKLTQLGNITGDVGMDQLNELQKQTLLLEDMTNTGDILQGLTRGIALGSFATGGVVTSPTLALIGEGGEKEYVIPQSLMPLVQGAASSANSHSTGDININFGDIVVGEGGTSTQVVDEIMRKISTELRRGELRKLVN